MRRILQPFRQQFPILSEVVLLVPAMKEPRIILDGNFHITNDLSDVDSPPTYRGVKLAADHLADTPLTF